jgi:glutathione S-transferase
MAVTVKAMGWLVPAERRGMMGFGNHEAVLDVLEQAVSVGPWICGEQFTAADVYTGSGLLWGMQFGTLERRPAFAAYAARLQARPAAQRAQALDDALILGR